MQEDKKPAQEKPEMGSNATPADKHIFDQDTTRMAKAQIQLLDILVNAVVSSFQKSGSPDKESGE